MILAQTPNVKLNGFLPLGTSIYCPVGAFAGIGLKGGISNEDGESVCPAR